MWVGWPRGTSEGGRLAGQFGAAPAGGCRWQGRGLRGPTRMGRPGAGPLSEEPGHVCRGDGRCALRLLSALHRQLLEVVREHAQAHVVRHDHLQAPGVDLRRD